MAGESASKVAVYAALIGNLLIAVTKAVAAWWTGSSSMLSEAVHSLVDTGNELLLLYGMHRAGKTPDPVHPLGHGRELYFWSFVVALLVFALGAGVAVYEGVVHILHPEPIKDPLINYIVLALAFVFEGVSWTVSWRAFSAAKGELGIYDAFRRSKDPPLFMVLFEDTAALIGIVIAALGTFAAASLHMPEADGVASIVIGLVLALVAVLLARESKSLLIGERADRGFGESIMRIAQAHPHVVCANGVLTVQLAPDQIVVALSLDFEDAITAREVEQAVVAIERDVRAAHPEVTTLFVKPEALATFQNGLQQRYKPAPST